MEQAWLFCTIAGELDGCGRRGISPRKCTAKYGALVIQKPQINRFVTISLLGIWNVNIFVSVQGGREKAAQRKVIPVLFAGISLVKLVEI